MKNIQINLYLVAFYAVLAKSLAFTLGCWEFGTLTALLVKLSFDSWQANAQVKEDSEPIKAELKLLKDKTNQLDNSIKLIKFNSK